MIIKNLNLLFSALLVSALGTGSGHAQTVALICDSSFSEPRPPSIMSDSYPITHLPNVVLIRFDGTKYKLSMVHTEEVLDENIRRYPGSNRPHSKSGGDYFKKEFVTLNNAGIDDDGIWWISQLYGRAELNRHTLHISGDKKGVGKFGARECVKVPDETYNIAFAAFTDMVAEYNDFVASSISHQKKVLGIIYKLSNGI